MRSAVGFGGEFLEVDRREDREESGMSKELSEQARRGCYQEMLSGLDLDGGRDDGRQNKSQKT